MKRLIVSIILSTAIILNLSAKTYKRIVSLAPSITQSIYFLEAQDLLVGCTNYCTLAKKDNKEVVASAIKPNIEKILSLKPDLVIGSGLTNIKDIAILEKFGVKIVIYQTPKSFEEICSQFVALGRLIDKESKAVDIVNESKTRVDVISRKIRHRDRPTIFFQIGANPIFSVLDNTFMSDYISFLRGDNIASNLKHGVVGREFVLSKNPSIIIITTMGIVGEKEKSVWEQYTNLKAVRDHRVYIVDSEIACQPSPISFAQTMELLYEAIVNNRR